MNRDEARKNLLRKAVEAALGECSDRFNINIEVSSQESQINTYSVVVVHRTLGKPIAMLARVDWWGSCDMNMINGRWYPINRGNLFYWWWKLSVSERIDSGKDKHASQVLEENGLK